MFSIYGSTGRVFRGTLEQLRELPRVHASERTRALAPPLRDVRDGEPREALEYTPAPSPAGAAGGGTGVAADTHRAAIAAYTRTQHAAAPLPWYMTEVQAVMTRPAFTVSSDASVTQAWQQLAHDGRGQAPVVNLGGTLVGLLTRASFAGLAPWTAVTLDAAEQAEWESTSVEAIMVTPVPSVAPQTDLRHATDALLDSELPGLPVVDDDGKVQGFISRTDVLRAALRDAGLDVWG